MSDEEALENVPPVFVSVKDDLETKYANPGPLGLASFAISIILLSLRNAGAWPEMDRFFAFTCYGFFWLSLCAVKILPAAFRGIERPSEVAMSLYLLIWALFTIFPFVMTFKIPAIHLTQIIFFELIIFFFLSSLSHLLEHYFAFKTAKGFRVLSGVVGVFVGTGAAWMAFAEIVNENLSKPLIPFQFQIHNAANVFVAEAMKKIKSRKGEK